MEPVKNSSGDKHAEPVSSSPDSSDKQTKRRFSSRLKSFWKSLEPTLRIIIFSGALIFFFFGMYQFYKQRAERTTKRFLEPYEQTESIMETRMNEIKTDEIRTTQEKLMTIKRQFDFLSNRKKHHYEVAIYFMSNYNASVLIVLFSAVSAIIIIFIIASKGWIQTHSYVKAVFLVLVFISIFFSVFPSVFGQRSNFEQNRLAFLRYDNLQVEIFNYLMTNNASTGSVGNNSADSMIVYVNKRINEFNQIYISNAPSPVLLSDDMKAQLKSEPAMPRNMESILADPEDSLEFEDAE